MATSTGSISTSAGPLDVNTLVSQLMAAESTVLNPLTQQASSYNSLISAYGTLKSTISAYQSALNGLSTASFSAQKADVVNSGTGTTLTTDPFTADVNSDDSTKILSQKIQSTGFPKSQIFAAGDSLAIKVGTGAPTFVTLKANATLSGVRDAINASKSGVTASIVTDGTGDHLLLESNTGGTANTIKVQANGSLSQFAYDPLSSVASTMTQTQAPRDETAAASGNYTVAVSQLAQAQKITSDGFVDGYQFNSGILAIKTGTGTTTIIKPTSNSLAGVRDAINASDAGVSATIVSDGTAAHLVISAKDSGANNSIRVTGTGDFAPLTFDPSGKFTSTGVTTGQTYTPGAGSGLTLKVGGTTTNINLGSTAQTLQQVSDAINAANVGVTASITNDGSKDHLVLTPSGAGAKSAVSLTGTGDYADLTGGTMGQLQAAQDAKLSIDGVTVTSTSNQVTDAISGVTLNLTKVTTADDNFTLNISNDTSGVISTANTFVSAYNTLAKAIANMTQQTPSTTLGQAGTSSPLASETSVQGMMSQLRSALFGSVTGGGDISTLSDIGISFQKDGTLALDSTKITSAITDNFAGIANLFGATTKTNDDGTTSGSNGILTNLQTLLTGFLSDTGIIATKTNGLQASLKINTDRQGAINDRLANLKDQYTNQFNALNVTLATMASTQSYLTQQLANLPKAG